MPDRDVKTIRDLIYYQYAKIIAKTNPLQCRGLNDLDSCSFDPAQDRFRRNDKETPGASAGANHVEANQFEWIPPSRLSSYGGQAAGKRRTSKKVGKVGKVRRCEKWSDR
jgi:hypothetical protein